MANAGITVRGIPEAQAALRDFPRVLVLQAFNKALSRAIAVFEDEIRSRIPESDSSTSSEEYGHLIDNLGSLVTLDTSGKGGRAVVTFGNAFWWAFVEYGHRMLSHSKQPTKRDVVAAQPFARPAFAAAADRAIDVFAEEIRSYLGSA